MTAVKLWAVQYQDSTGEWYICDYGIFPSRESACIERGALRTAHHDEGTKFRVRRVYRDVKPQDPTR